VYQETISSIPPDTVVYVDETGIDRYLYRPYARSLKGISVQGKISGKKYERTSIAAGQCGKQIIAPLQYSGTMDSKLFTFWFEAKLLPQIRSGSVIVLDNARFHPKKVLYELANRVGCHVLFLPPYSPDLNPIEHFWAWLKARLRKILPSFPSLNAALLDCFNVA
jgi:transposase